MVIEEKEKQRCHSAAERAPAKDSKEDAAQQMVHCLYGLKTMFTGVRSQVFAEAMELLCGEFRHMQPKETALFDTMRGYCDWVFWHSIRVAVISLAIADRLPYTREQRQVLVTGALWHDIGKLLIPIEILQKNGPLTEEEMRVMRRHSMLGYKIVDELTLPGESKLAVLQHHERLDGSGYPFGLGRHYISRDSGIVMVADVIEAMTACRPYRAALPLSQAVGTLLRDAEKYPTDVLAIVEQMAGGKAPL